MITDLENNPLKLPDWDEKKLFSPHVSKLKLPTSLSDDALFAKALKANVAVSTCSHGRIDNCINDIVTITCLYERYKRLRGATLLALLF